MLDEKDIKKLKEILATKEDLKDFATKDDLKNFATKDDFKDLKGDFKNLKLDLISAMEKVFPTKVEMDKRFDKVEESFSDLQTSVDTYAKQANTYFQEMVILNNNYRRLEGWIHLVAEKVGVELKY